MDELLEAERFAILVQVSFRALQVAELTDLYLDYLGVLLHFCVILILIIFFECELETAHVLLTDHVPPIFEEVLVISEGVVHVADEPKHQSYQVASCHLVLNGELQRKLHPFTENEPTS